MNPSAFQRLTPRVSVNGRFFAAALTWLGIGLFLSAKGVYFSGHAETGLRLLGIGVGLGLGYVKSRFIFDRVAQKIITQIHSKPARACLGSIFSLQNWGLIVIMVIFGRMLGASSLNAGVKTGIYVMVGSGLAFSSRRLWAAWKHSGTTC